MVATTKGRSGGIEGDWLKEETKKNTLLSFTCACLASLPTAPVSTFHNPPPTHITHHDTNPLTPPALPNCLKSSPSTLRNYHPILASAPSPPLVSCPLSFRSSITGTTTQEHQHQQRGKTGGLRSSERAGVGGGRRSDSSCN
jgi:hypothetical protein